VKERRTLKLLEMREGKQLQQGASGPA
jgi:hypothetical protein